MEIETGEGQLQIHLVTKQIQYAVPDIPYSIGASVTQAELNTFINALLQENGDAKSTKPIDFEFIILNEFLRARLSDHLKERSISFEDTIEIEYVERFPVPEPQECLLHDDWVSSVKTHDKWILTGCYDNTVNVWLVNGKHLLTIPGHSAPIKAVSWISVDDNIGTFASASQDQTVMIWEWNIASNAVDCIYVCKGHERGVDALASSPSSKLLASGSWDTMLKIWSCELHGNGDNDDGDEVSNKRLKGEQTRTPISTLSGHREAISGIQWLGEDTILTGSWDHTIRVWDLSNGGIKTEINGNKPIFSMSHSKMNGLVVTGSADKNIRLYDLRSNSGTIVKNTYTGHTQWIQSVCWSTTEEHLFISGSYDNQVKLWDMRSPKAPLFDLLGHEDKVHDCDWSNPKYMVSGGADNSVRIFKSKKTLQSQM